MSSPFEVEVFSKKEDRTFYRDSLGCRTVGIPGCEGCTIDTLTISNSKRISSTELIVAKIKASFYSGLFDNIGVSSDGNWIELKFKPDLPVLTVKPLITFIRVYIYGHEDIIPYIRELFYHRGIKRDSWVFLPTGASGNGSEQFALYFYEWEMFKNPDYFFEFIDHARNKCIGCNNYSMIKFPKISNLDDELETYRKLTRRRKNSFYDVVTAVYKYQYNGEW